MCSVDIIVGDLCLWISDSYLIARHVVDKHAQVGGLCCTSCNDDSTSEVLCQAAFLDLVEYGFDDLLHTGCDDL